MEFITKHPYARTTDIIKTFTINDFTSHNFICNSDTTYNYPYEIVISIAKDCNLQFNIVSTVEGSGGITTQIKNCIAGETITMDAINKIILTDKKSHDIANDFNYVFPCITCGKENEINTLSGNGYFTIALKYYEARKVVLW